MSNIGRRGALGIGLETSGSEGTTTAIDMFIPYLSCNLIGKHTPIADVSAKGMRDIQGNDTVEGKKWGEGSIEVVLEPRSAPYWFGLVLGSISSSVGIDPLVNYHTITRKSDNQPLTATISRDRVVDEVKFPYSVVNTLELNFADDVAKVSVDVLSQFPIVEGDTPTYVDLELYTFKHAYVELTVSGATSTITIREFTLNVNNNAEVKHVPNDNDADKIVSKGFEVNGTISVDFETTVQRDAFKNVTKQALSVVLTDSTNIITITVPQIRVNTLDIDTPNDDISGESIGFVAEYDATTSKTIDVVVENNVTSY